VTPNVPAKIPPVNPKLKAGVGWRFVKPGDTLASIAKRYGTTEAALRGLNTANNLNRFSPGETIRVRYAAGPKTGK
jgi:murein DD-endopeptidase MepM/ murein hydrolase activator NlpD